MGALVGDVVTGEAVGGLVVGVAVGGCVGTTTGADVVGSGTGGLDVVGDGDGGSTGEGVGARLSIFPDVNSDQNNSSSSPIYNRSFAMRSFCCCCCCCFPRSQLLANDEDNDAIKMVRANNKLYPLLKEIIVFGFFVLVCLLGSLVGRSVGRSFCVFVDLFDA